MVLAWQDKRLVKMVSTMHADTMETVEVKQKGSAEKVAQQKPTCVTDYNKYMNGVDRLDQNIAYYPFARRSYRWPYKFVIYLFQISCYNSYVLYKAKGGGRCKTLMDFILSIVTAWTRPVVGDVEGGGDEEMAEEVVICGDEVGEVVAGREVGGSDSESDPGGPRVPRAPHLDPECRREVRFAGHALARYPQTPQKKIPTRRCAKQKKRSETGFYCVKCGVPLHPGKCFEEYHSKLNLA